MRSAYIAYYTAYYPRSTSASTADPPVYQNADSPCIEAMLDAHARVYAQEHTFFAGVSVAPYGAKSARQGTPGRARARRQGPAAGVNNQLPQEVEMTLCAALH